MEPASNASAPLNLKASLHPFTVLELLQLELEAIKADLQQRLEQAPQLLKNAPVVIQLPKQPIDLEWAQQLISLLKDLHFIPVGLRIDNQQSQLAEHLELPIFSESSKKPAIKPDTPGSW